MENKYYTPDISEFHVGFEYEVYDTKWKYSVEHIEGDKFRILSDPESSTDWYHKVYDVDDYVHVKGIEGDTSVYCSLQDHINAGDIRVKYLDKADIEELGFEYIEDRGMVENYGYLFQMKDPLYNIKDDGWMSMLQLKYWYNTNRIQIRSSARHSDWFDGTIRNKSELKVLLKQLNIL